MRGDWTIECTQDEQKVWCKVDELTGPGLAWAVATARGLAPTITAGRVAYRDDGHGSWVDVLLDEAECVELQEDALIGVERPYSRTNGAWRALADFTGKKDPHRYCGVVAATDRDLKTALFRCFVKSRLGEAVHIPGALVADRAD